MLTLAELSAQLRLGDRVVNTGNRPGRNEREKLRAAAAAGRITAHKPWQWADNDPELEEVKKILRGDIAGAAKLALKEKRAGQKRRSADEASDSAPDLPPLSSAQTPIKHLRTADNNHDDEDKEEEEEEEMIQEGEGEEEEEEEDEEDVVAEEGRVRLELRGGAS